MELDFNNRKIIKLKKPNGSTQYFLTLPKGFAESLIDKEKRDLLVISNDMLVAFPKGADIEQKIMEFLAKHQWFLEQNFEGGKNE